MSKSVKSICVVLVITLIFVTLSGCIDAADKSSTEYPIFTSFHDIPGISQNEVDLIEESYILDVCSRVEGSN